MLWIQAMQHLQAGITLKHGEASLNVNSNDPTVYELHQAGITTPHNHIMDAIDAFASSVGNRGLRDAIAASRYRALFRCGSSLEWPVKPLASWQSPEQWLKTAC